LAFTTILIILILILLLLKTVTDFIVIVFLVIAVTFIANTFNIVTMVTKKEVLNNRKVVNKRCNSWGVAPFNIVLYYLFVQKVHQQEHLVFSIACPEFQNGRN